MSKIKNTILVALSFVLVAALAIGGTVAYLTDTDSDVNVMTLGNVSIIQHEYQREVDANGDYVTATVDGVTSYTLENFTQAKPLLPVITDPASSGWDSTIARMTQVDSYGQVQFFATPNAQDKIVTVENDGKTDAYVRTLIAFELGSIDISAFGDIISTSMRADYTHDGSTPWLKNDIGSITVDGNNYVLVELIYLGGKLSDGTWRHENGVLPAGDTTYPGLCQVYMRSAATNADVEAIDGNGNGTYDILVFSQAVQAAGFDSAEVALDAAFGDITTTNHPWVAGAAVPVTVNSLDDMTEALENGAKSVVVKGADITSNPLNGHYYVDRDIAYVDCNITADMNWMYVNNATFTNCTFNSAGAAVHYDEIKGDIVFNNCTFIAGKVQIGAGGTVTFNDCEFADTANTSIWSDKGIRVYSPAEFNNCEFANRVILAGSSGLELTFNSCTMNGGTPVYYVDNSDGIIRGGNVPNITINN